MKTSTAQPPILVRASALAGIDRLVSSRGSDVTAFLLEQGIDSDLLHRPEATLELAKVIALLEICARELAIEDFGLQLAALQDISVLGPLAAIALHSGTVAEALTAVSSRLSYHSPGLASSLVRGERGSRAYIKVEMRVPVGQPRRQGMELSFGVLSKFVRMAAPDDWANCEIRFRHAPGMDLERYRVFFGCEVLFEQEFDGLTMPDRVLDAGIQASDPVLRRVAEAYVAGVIQRYPLDIVAQVEALASRQLPSGRCTLPIVAGQLGLNMRTLQRRLSMQGFRFEDIVDRIRQVRVREYLAIPQIPLSQLATLLGYSEQSSFNRACQRWFSMTPLQLQASLQTYAVSQDTVACKGD